MPAAANDLTTVAKVVELLGAADNAADAGASAIIQTLVTAMSVFVLQTELRRRSVNGQATLTDILDGSGSDKMVMKDWPIISITSLTVYGVAIPASPDNIQAGYTFDERSIMLLPSTAIGSPIASAGYVGLGRFPRARQNVQIVYTAGYSASTTPPSDVNYNNAPTDLGAAVTYLVAQEYKRRKWIDQSEKSIAQGEHIKVRDWEWPPWVNRTFESYRRWWAV